MDPHPKHSLASSGSLANDSETGEGPGGKAGGDGHQPIWSCVICRRRKIKCDRREPCNNCIKNDTECHYPVTGRLPNRSRAPQWSSAHHKQADLLQRLRRLEAVVTELSAQVDEVNSSSPMAMLQSNGIEATRAYQTPSSAAPSSSTDADKGLELESEAFGQLVTGSDGRVRIEKSFWSVFCDEVDHIFQSIQEASETADESDNQQGHPAASTCCCHLFALGQDGSVGGSDNADIAPTQASFLLQTYKERVDPFVKILTSDSLKSLLETWSTPHSQLDPAYAALRSSVLFGAAASLTSAEVTTAFAKQKTYFVAEMRSVVEKDLARAKFLSTADMTVIQALVIYASMLPHANIHDIAGAVAAVTVQIVMQNGLHKEEERQKRGDADARLLIWLQVCFLASPFPSTDVAVSEWPPEVIAIIELKEDSSSNGEGWKTLLRTRLRIWQLSRQLRRLAPSEAHQVMALVEAGKADTERQYLTTLHRGQKRAFEAFIEKMAQLFFAKINHAILAQKWHRQDKSRASDHGHDSFEDAKVLSEVTMAILEFVHSLATQPDWAPWRWQLRGSFPWLAMKLVFAQFCDCEWTPLSERAWVLANTVIGTVSDSICTEPAWAELHKLMDKAAEHRESEISRMTLSVIGGSDYMGIFEAGQQRFFSEGLQHIRPSHGAASSESSHASQPKSISGGGEHLGDEGRKGQNSATSLANNAWGLDMTSLWLQGTSGGRSVWHEEQEMDMCVASW